MSPRLSLLASFAQRYSVLIIRLASLVVLSRLLSPGEFGVFAAAWALVALGLVLADCGVQQALIQAREPSLPLQRAALGLSLLACLGAAALLAALCLLAPAALIGESLRSAVAVLTLTLPLYPFTSVGTGLLQREMRFGALGVVGIAGAVGSVATAVALAWGGYGYLSLCWAAVAESAITAGLVGAMSRPARPSLAGWRALGRFGGVWIGINGLRQAGDSLCRLLIGSALGYGAVGMLTRAQTVVGLFDRCLTDAVSPVLLPALAQHHRSGAALGPAHVRKVAYVAAVAWPFFGLIALCAEPLVRVLLGPQWTEAAGLVRILSLSGLMLPFSGFVLPFLVTLDITARYLPLQGIVQAAKVALVAVATQVSLELACAALLIDPMLKSLLVHRLLSRHLATERGSYARPLMTSIAVTAAALLGALAVLAVPGLHQSPAQLLAACALAAGALWLAAVLGLGHPLAREIRHLARLVVDGGGAAVGPALQRSLALLGSSRRR